MFVAVTLVAVLLAWFAAARNQADLQDQLVTTLEERGGHIWARRWGPGWLDLVGGERFRRRVIGAEDTLGMMDEGLVKQIAHLSELRYLHIEVGRLTAGMVEALGEMRQMRYLSLEQHRENDADEPFSRECLAAIGKMTKLEALDLGMAISSEDLACLAGLTNLKSLCLYEFNESYQSGDEEDVDGFETGRHDHDHEQLTLEYLPALPRLEFFGIWGDGVSDQDLPYLAALSHLKSLALIFTSVTDEGLKNLPPFEFLEALTIGGDMASTAGLESMLALKRLNTLHLDPNQTESEGKGTLILDDGDEWFVSQAELEGCRRAIEALRQARPGIVIKRHSFEEYRIGVSSAVLGNNVEPYWSTGMWGPWLPSNPASMQVFDQWEQEHGNSW